MKILQFVLLKVLSLCLAFGGVLAIAFRFSAHFQKAQAHLPDAIDPVGIWLGAGGACLILGILGMLPAGSRRGKRKMISFPGTDGTSNIYLEPIEANLNRSLAKLPDIKKVSVSLIPIEGGRRLRVSADAIVQSGATGSLREISDRLREQIGAHTKKVVGVDEITSVELHICGGIGGVAPDSVSAPSGAADLDVDEEPVEDVPEPALDEEPADLLEDEHAEPVTGSASSSFDDSQDEEDSELPSPGGVLDLDDDDPVTVSSKDETSESTEVKWQGLGGSDGDESK